MAETEDSEVLPLPRMPTPETASPSMTTSQRAYSSLCAVERKLSQSSMTISMVWTFAVSKRRDS